MATLIEKVRERPKKALLEGRTEVVKGKRRLVRGERYFDLPSEIVAAVPKALEMFAVSLQALDRPKPEQLELIDAAFRVAGTGSLGALRIAALVKGKGDGGGDSNAWILDIKEEGTPSAASLAPPPPMAPAERVVTAIRACVQRPPRMLGTTTLGDKSMLVRRLSPQEDKLDLSHLPASELAAVADYLGALTGAAHARGRRPNATNATKAWTHVDREALIDGAIAMAGVHEVAYLSWCRITR